MRLTEWQKEVLKDMQEANPINIYVHKGESWTSFLKYVAEKFPELYYIYFVAKTDADFIEYQKSKKNISLKVKMEKLNKYGKLSGGYIFDTLDRIAHKQAIKYIGECVTVSAEIKYFQEVEGNIGIEHILFDVIDRKSSSIVFQYNGPYFYAIFTFIKRK